MLPKNEHHCHITLFICLLYHLLCLSVTPLFSFVWHNTFFLPFAFSLYGVLFLACFKMTTDLENFQIFLIKTRFFTKVKVSTLTNSTALPLLRLERVPSELPFAYSLYGVLFLICFKTATELPENFQIFWDKIGFFQNSEF